MGLPASLQQAINEYLNGAPFSEVLADGKRLSQGYVKGKGETPHVVTKRDVQDMAIRIPSIYDEPYSYLVAARRLRSDGTGRIVDTPRVTKHSIKLQVCCSTGEVRINAEKRAGAAYRALRKAGGWGQRLDIDQQG